MSLKNQKIDTLKGISVKRAALFKKIGIETVYDLLTYFPRDYIDYEKPQKLSETEIGTYAVIKARVIKKLKPIITSRSSVSVFKLILSDTNSETDFSEFVCVFFNNPYSFEKLFVGKEYLFYGKIGGNDFIKELLNPLFIEIDTPNKLVPKYRLTSGLSHTMIANSVKLALPLYLAENLPEPVPETIIAEHSLYSLNKALAHIHFPADNEDFKASRRRLAFDELLTLQLGMSMLKTRNRKLTGAVMKALEINEFYKSLPFNPTNAQIKAITDAINDMTSSEKIPMNRLLQGDVGSGKTLVAAAICYFVYKNNYQSVIMAPTEILAVQHYATLKGFVEPLGVNTVLLTGSLTAAEKNNVKKLISTGVAHIIVGTHAIIQKNVKFQNLGLAVTDEQHRFGVGQRSALISKGDNPHMLVMSATPIPRTLALIIYADLDISVLNEMPKGRIPIKTYCVDTSFRERLYKFIIKHVEKGRQAYIVCPLITDAEGETANEKTSAVEYYEMLKNNWFNGITLGLLHGKMKQAEKSEVMTAFKRNELSVLVSTTVIEVGVDVPNSVIMLIENAEQFGLSQLHQLRGRIGRGTEQSYCILVTDSNSEYTKARTDIMVKTSDGFDIANEDLRLRGPGDFFGAKQHGLPELKIADMTGDIELINEVKITAKKILSKDSDLSEPENFGLAALVNQLFGEGIIHGFN